MEKALIRKILKSRNEVHWASSPFCKIVFCLFKNVTVDISTTYFFPNKKWFMSY
jgi:hypothetical protein